jgi:hypothetical protein
MIVTNVFVCHAPVAALVYGVNSSHPAPFVRPYDIYENVQLAVFALQEVFISGLYIYYATKILGPAFEMRGKNRKTMMMQLIYINFVLIVLDVVIVSLQYAGLYEVQTSLKPAVYSIKLKLEFNVLNHLLKGARKQSQHFMSDPNSLGKTVQNTQDIANTEGENEEVTSPHISFAQGDHVGQGEMQFQGAMRAREANIDREGRPDRDGVNEATGDSSAGNMRDT